MGEKLSQLGDDVHIAVLDCEENRKRMQVEAPHCIPEWFDAPNPFVEAWQKLKIARRLRPDILFMLTYGLRNLAFLSFLLPRRTRLVIEFAELYSAFLGSRLVWIIKEHLAIFECDVLSVASRCLKDIFEARVKRWHLNRLICYLPFAYPDYLRPSRVEDDDVLHVVFMASLWKVYGVFDVMEAFSRLLKERTDMVLDVIGGGSEMQNVLEWVRERNLGYAIKIHGYVAEDQLNTFFSKADVFVSPLHDTIQDWARCPSKVFYYIPYNKPIVTCKIGNPFDVLGSNGFYYVPDDIQDMVRAIGDALDASSRFAYPTGFIDSHSWMARATVFHNWMAIERVR